MWEIIESEIIKGLKSIFLALFLFQLQPIIAGEECRRRKCEWTFRVTQAEMMQWIAKLSISFQQKKKREWLEFDESIIFVNGDECREIIDDGVELGKRMNFLMNFCYF